MRLLLDTQVLLWTLNAPGRLSATDQSTITNRLNTVMFSAASIWEIAIKASLRRQDFQADAADVLQLAEKTGFIELPVTGSTAMLVTDLPMHHRDPFDRLIVAQAIDAPARLFTADALLTRYSELVHIIKS